MPDFLDSLISRTFETKPALRPRVPGLFERVPASYGPGGGFKPPVDKSIDDLPGVASGQSIAPPGMEQTSSAWVGYANRSTSLVSESSDSLPPGRAPSDNDRTNTPAQALNPALAADRPTAGLFRIDQFQQQGVLERLHALEDLTRFLSAPTLSSASKRSNPPPFLAQVAVPPNEVAQPAGAGPYRPSTQSSFNPSDELGVLPDQIKSGLSFPAISDEQSGTALPESYSSKLLSRLTDELEAIRRPDIGDPNVRADKPSLQSQPSRTAVSAPPSGDGFRSLAVAPLQIQVNIGRVEVRAAPAPAPVRTQSRSSQGAAPLSLDEYLRRINGDSR